MNERNLSELQKEYQDFFLEKLSLYGVKSPVELTKEKKSEFFTDIKQDWAKIKIAISQTKEFYKSKPNNHKKTRATIQRRGIARIREKSTTTSKITIEGTTSQAEACTWYVDRCGPRPGDFQQSGDDLGLLGLSLIHI